MSIATHLCLSPMSMSEVATHLSLSPMSRDRKRPGCRGIRAFASNLDVAGSLELVTALLADAQLVLAVLLVTDAGNLTALGANEIDVGGIDRSLL